MTLIVPTVTVDAPNNAEAVEGDAWMIMISGRLAYRLSPLACPSFRLKQKRLKNVNGNLRPSAGKFRQITFYVYHAFYLKFTLSSNKYA